MNVHTFKDVVTSKRSSLANDIDEDEDEVDVAALADDIDGEEDDGHEKFNEIGEVIEPFNLRNEREQGHFDTNMNFVWRKERAEPDAWLANMDEAAMEKSIGEAAAALKLKKQKEADSEGPENRSDKWLKTELLRLLRPGETVITAMHRLGGKKSKAGPRVAVKRRRLPTHTSDTAAAEPSSSSLSSDPALKSVQGVGVADKAAINRLTELADQLISTGLTGLYDMTYESIESSMFMWEYKGQDGCVHGPYTSRQISDWRKAGYFTGPSAVHMRHVSEAPEHSHVADKSKSIGSVDVSVRNETGKMSRPQDYKEEPIRKRRRGASADDHASNQELLDDLEDDDDDEEDDEQHSQAGRERGQRGAGAQAKDGNREPIAVQKPTLSHGPWISSDDLDFGDFIELPDEQPDGQEAEADEDDDDM